MVEYEEEMKSTYRYWLRVCRDELVSGLNIRSSLLLDKLRELDVITQEEDEYIRVKLNLIS